MILLNCVTMILLLERSIADKNTLPVFMIDQDQVMGHIQMEPNPFGKMTVGSFADIIHDAIKRSDSIILFIEDSFCTEDISSKDKFGSPYMSLRNGISENKVKYFPSVMEPYKLLTQIFQPQQYNVFYLRSHTKIEMMDNYKYIYIFFQDGINETRSDVLRRHDAIIRDVLFVVRQLKPGPIVAFYTGKVNPMVVQKTEFVTIKPNPVPRDMGVMIVSTGAMFRFTGVFATTPARRAFFNQMPLIADETYKLRRMSTRMAYTDFELEFNFNFQEKGWILDNVALLEAGEEVGRTEICVGAPWNWSYVCGEPLVIINTRDGSSVTISQYQIQPRAIIYRRSMRALARRKAELEVINDITSTQRPKTRQEWHWTMDEFTSTLYIHTKPNNTTPDPKNSKKQKLKKLAEDLENTAGAPIELESDVVPGPESESESGPGPEPDQNEAKSEKAGNFGPAINCGPYFNAHILAGLFVTFLCIGITMYGIVSLMDVKSNDRYEDPNSKPIQHAFT